MKIISIIDNFDIIEQILKHLNLWDIRNYYSPEIEPVYISELTYVEDSDYDNSGSQIPVFDTFWGIFFRVIKIFSHFLTKGKKAFTYPLI